MRKPRFVLLAASVLAVAAPAVSIAGSHRGGHHQSPAPAATAHASHPPGPHGNGHSGGGGGGASSSTIGLIAPWGNAAYSGGQLTVTYAIGASPGVPASAVNTVQSAVSGWNGCLSGGSGCGGFSAKGKFTFTQASGSPLVSITIKKGGGTVAGSTKLSYSGGFISGARLQISASSFGSPNTTNTIYEIALHELGHVVGLGHSDDPADLMYPVLNNVTAFGSCEVNGMNALYGSWLPGGGSPTLPSQSSVSC